MFSLTISFGNPMTMWTLMFRAEETANAASAIMHGEDPKISINDDFGQTINIERKQIHGWISENMDLSMLAHVQRALHQARMQAKGAEAAETDPVLRAARYRQGPAVLAPGMNGPMR